MSSFTYGSFGDIITTIQIAARLSQALSNTRGSAREFQELVLELRTFQRVLDQLVFSWQTRAECAELEGLVNTITPVVRSCKDAVTNFLQDAMSQYGKSLMRPPTSSRRSFKDVVKMIQWNLLEKNEVIELRDKLRRSKELVDMVNIQVQEFVYYNPTFLAPEICRLYQLDRISKEQNQERVSERLATIIDTENQVLETLDKQLDEIAEKLSENVILTARIDNNVQALLQAMTFMNQDFSALVHSLSPFGTNVLCIEDPFGWPIRIPLDVVQSWEAIDCIINDWFSGRPGQELVRMRRYALQDRSTGRDIRRRGKFRTNTQPGQALIMTMIYFFDKYSNGGSMDNRITGTNDEDDELVDYWTATARALSLAAKETDDDINEDEAFQNITAMVTEYMLAMESQATCYDSDLKFFKRIRLLSSWQTLENSMSLPNYQLGDVNIWAIHFDGRDGYGWAQMALALATYLYDLRNYLYSGVSRSWLKQSIRNYDTGGVGLGSSFGVKYELDGIIAKTR
ncbi:hypothetical protein GQ53DRAFT_840947 [Thozetella sp. PMI_491]|nr:hypothetical protein GQ53DRAFT_840947 [Thozetella sp. PMI_491]